MPNQEDNNNETAADETGIRSGKGPGWFSSIFLN